MLRYALAAAEPAGPSTTYASSSFTRYRNGRSAVTSPDAFFPLTRPQMVSTDCPSVFFRIARCISPNSADAGFSSLAAIVVFALMMTGSGFSAGGLDAAASAFAAIVVDSAFFASGRVGLSLMSADDGFSVLATADFSFLVVGLALNE